MPVSIRGHHLIIAAGLIGSGIGATGASEWSVALSVVFGSIFGCIGVGIVLLEGDTWPWLE